jgi:hypothetical protein
MKLAALPKTIFLSRARQTGKLMGHKFTNGHSLIPMLGMFVLLTVQAHAQTEQTQTRVIQDIAPVGLAYGQTLRITVANPPPAAAPRGDLTKYKMLVAPLILDAEGRVIARRDEVTLAPGEFHSFDFKRADLPLPGEPGTGRLQVRGAIQRRLFQGFVSRFSSGPSTNTVVELVDDLTGQTEAMALLRVETSPTSSSEQCLPQPIPLGLAHEQSLRVSVVNANGTLLVSKQQPLRARVRLDDAGGNLIAQSTELVIPPGEFRFYDFARSSLPLTGEDPTGRVQMAANVFLKFDSAIDQSDSASVTLELVANVSGRTISLLLPAVQKVRDFPLPNS